MLLSVSLFLNIYDTIGNSQRLALVSFVCTAISDFFLIGLPFCSTFPVVLCVTWYEKVMQIFFWPHYINVHKIKIFYRKLVCCIVLEFVVEVAGIDKRHFAAILEE